MMPASCLDREPTRCFYIKAFSTTDIAEVDAATLPLHDHVVGPRVRNVASKCAADICE
jgi:hypothetical protein